MKSKIKNGVEVKSRENLGSPRTIVTKKKRRQVVDQYQGPTKATFYVDLDPNLKFETSCYTKDSRELKINSLYLVEYNNINKLVSKLPENTTPQTYIHNLLQKKFEALSKEYISQKTLEGILNNEKDLKATIHTNMYYYMTFYGIKLLDSSINVTIGEKVYQKDEIKDMLDKIPTKEDVKKDINGIEKDINKAITSANQDLEYKINEVNKQQEQNYLRIKEEFIAMMDKLKIELEKSGSYKEILTTIESNLGELKYDIQNVREKISETNNEYSKGYNLLEDKITSLETTVYSLAKEKELNKEQLKYALKEIITYISEDANDVSKKVSNSCATDIANSMAGMDPNLAYNEEARELIVKSLENTFKNIIRGAVSDFIPID